MIEVVGRINVAPGKVQQAVEWAKKLIARSKKAGLRGEGVILRPITGEVAFIAFVGRYASMGEFEELRAKRRADSEWAAIAKEGFDSGWYLGTRRNIYEVVDE